MSALSAILNAGRRGGRVLSSVLLAALLGFGMCGAVHAQPQGEQHVQATLVSDVGTVVPGSVFTVAVKLVMDPGWHTYWKNPGDTGLPTTVAWTLPEGVIAGGKVLDADAGELQWPAPQAQQVGPFINYGFEHEVLLLTGFSYVPTSTPPSSSLTLKARVDWLMCRDICIPDGADVSLTLKVSSSPTDLAAASIKDVAAIAAAQTALPLPLKGWQMSARGDGAVVTLRLQPEPKVEKGKAAQDAGAERPVGALAAVPADKFTPGALYFFSDHANTIEPSFAQTMQRDGEAIMLTLPVSHQLTENGLPRLQGVLRAALPWGDEIGTTAVTIDVPVSGVVQAGPVPTFNGPPAARPPGMALEEQTAVDAGAASTGIAGSGANGGAMSFSLGMAALFALLGGVMLNLMPCVFPIISLKVLGFMQHGDNRATLRHEALAFGAGVMATFIGLGVLLLALRTMGAHLGWGFQLQSPIMITVLALLFFVMALNLSGLFEFGMLVPSGLAGWTSKNRTLDALASGVLAVVVASPCTAPFMGAALGYALTQSTLTTVVVFAMLGLGMALPYALLAFFPAWQRFLPKPGAWMVRLRQLLAFPLYATVAWLAWVLAAQTDSDTELRLLMTLVAVAWVLWAWHGGRMAAKRRVLWFAAALAGVLVAAFLISPVFLNTTATATRGAAVVEDGWQPYSAEAVARENAAGKTVFVDFTAAWCVTCQANKKMVLNTDEVQRAFAQHGIVLMRADWTRQDPMISEALMALGRSGVPVYVFYRPGKPPYLLPELLQKGLVLEALATLSKS